MKLHKLTTNKLFFKKWPYRITTKIIGGSLIRCRSMNWIRDWCIDLSRPNPWAGQQFLKDRGLLLKYINKLEPFLDKNLKLRIQHDIINIYVDDPVLYEQLQDELFEFIVNITEPINEQELKVLLDNTKTIICDKYPKDLYKYKIVFKDMPVGVRTSLLNWADKYTENQLWFSEATRKGLKSSKPWWNEYFFYVADKNMLMLITLASQGYVRRTEEFILRSSINTILDQELTCQH